MRECADAFYVRGSTFNVALNKIHQTDEINQIHQIDEIDETDRIYGLTGYPTEDGLAKLLGSPLTSLQLGLRFLAVLYFVKGQAHLLAKKRLP